MDINYHNKDQRLVAKLKFEETHRLTDVKYSDLLRVSETSLGDERRAAKLCLEETRILGDVKYAELLRVSDAALREKKILHADAVDKMVREHRESMLKNQGEHRDSIQKIEADFSDLRKELCERNCELAKLAATTLHQVYLFIDYLWISEAESYVYPFKFQFQFL